APELAANTVALPWNQLITPIGALLLVTVHPGGAAGGNTVKPSLMRLVGGPAICTWLNTEEVGAGAILTWAEPLLFVPKHVPVPEACTDTIVYVVGTVGLTGIKSPLL